MNNKKTLVLGASMNPDRFSFKAINSLRMMGHDVVAIGRRPGRVNDVDIEVGKEPVDDLDTITLYLNPDNQKPYYDYILKEHPKRIIFNPGSENKELAKMAEEKGISTMNACTLIMLNTGQY